MKVLMLNGSPKANGNTAVALKEMENIWRKAKILLTFAISCCPRWAACIFYRKDG